jgi:ribonuclease PH
MRPVSFEPNVLSHPAGSCIARFGATRVLCSVSVDECVPPHVKAGGWLTAEYGMLPGSTSSRKSRSIGKQDGRSVEIQRLIGRSLRAAVKLENLGTRTLLIDCDVLDADGGTRTAAISGAWVALNLALRKLEQQGRIAQASALLTGQLAAVSVGIVDGKVICDLDYANDSRAEVDCNVVTLDGNLVEIQGTGEHGTFDRKQLNAMLDAAEVGLTAIRAAQIAAL